MMPSRYILRFDDICPTMNWHVWSEIESILVNNHVKPILAVVPDNIDKNLVCEKSHSGFWDEVRKWKSFGWTIAMHGFQHNLDQVNGGILGISSLSEFAGLEYEIQKRRFCAGLKIMKNELVFPQAWVAPAHSFDKTTLQLVRENGIPFVSDGCTLYPYTDRDGLVWVPQNIWRFHEMPFGVWTICFHHNKWTVHDLRKFRKNVLKYKKVVTNIEYINEKFKGTKTSWYNQLFQQCWLGMIRLKRKKRQWKTLQPQSSSFE